MPPGSKFTKEEIITAALNLVRAEGISALTARALGAELGSSARPIFTVFSSMEEVQQAVIHAAKALYGQYIEKGLAEEKPFRGVGAQYIAFSMREPRLFQLLFMKKQADTPALSGVLPMIDDNYEKILLSIQADSRVDKAFAERLYKHLWIYTHGIASLCATGMCRFTPEEISSMMADIYLGLLMKWKEEGHDQH